MFIPPYLYPMMKPGGSKKDRDSLGRFLMVIAFVMTTFSFGFSVAAIAAFPLDTCCIVVSSAMAVMGFVWLWLAIGIAIELRRE